MTEFLYEQTDIKSAMAKHAVYDSVFTNLFRDPEYTIQLYRALHPEDIEARAEDITVVTLQNVLVNQFYNDLGFTIGNRLMILVEAQSTWSDNILVRALLYLTKTIHNYLIETRQYVYGRKKVTFPKPEIYVIYTGDVESMGKCRAMSHVLSLSRDFFDGDSGDLDVKAKIVYDGQKGDIVYQYVMFTKICREQIRKYGKTRKAILETIRICKDRDVLKKYLQSRESEAVDIMITLFSFEEILDGYVQDELRIVKEETRAAQEETRAAQEETRAANERANVAEERTRAAQEEIRLANERANVAEKNMKQAAFRLYNLGVSLPVIAQSLSLDLDTVHALIQEDQAPHHGNVPESRIEKI